MQKGFSLIEVMVAGAIMSGLGYFMMTQQETAGKIQSKMSFNQDLNSLTTQIQTMLAVRANCTVTVSGKKVGDSITEIKYGIDDPFNPLVNPPSVDIDKGFFTEGQVFGGIGLQIQDIQLIDKKDPNDNTKSLGDAIRVSFRGGRLGNNNVFIPIKAMGSTQMNKDFMINGVKKPTGEYISCYSESGNLVETAIQDSCIAMGATWDPITKTCKLSNLPQCMVVEGGACGSLYVKTGEYRWNVNVYGRKLCTQEYKREFFTCGQKYFTRNCFCGGSTGINCNCDTGQVGCYSRTTMNCGDAPETKEVTALRCCRP